MKLIGFVKEYDDIKTSQSLNSFLSSKSTEKMEIEKIVSYLGKGILVFGWMGYFIDVQTKFIIAPNAYYTDGKWVWPSYLEYYLSKFSDIHIDSEFINDLKAKGFTFSFDDRLDLHTFENALQDIFRGADPLKYACV